MNKETRKFIWGMFLALTGTLAVSIHIVEMNQGTWKGGIDYFLFPMSIIGCILGGIHIYDSI